MYNINNVSELKEAIMVLENRQAQQKLLLIEQFDLTYESLKPINIIKNTLNEAVTSQGLLGKILLSAMGLTTGYLSKKLFVGLSGNLLRKFFGYLLQYGMTKLVVNPPEILKSSLSRLLQLAHRKQEIIS